MLGVLIYRIEDQTQPFWIFVKMDGHTLDENFWTAIHFSGVGSE
jgi:hypothetical protein